MACVVRSVIHSHARGLLEANARVRTLSLTPPVKFCHLTFMASIRFGPCSGGISITQEFGVHTCNLFQSPSFRLRESLCKYRSVYTVCPSLSFEITAVKRTGCFGNAVKTACGPFGPPRTLPSFSLCCFCAAPRLCD